MKIGQLFPCGDEPLSCDKARLGRALWKREEFRVSFTGEIRPPREGDWFLSGALIEGYRCVNDMSEARHIGRLVGADDPIIEGGRKVIKFFRRAHYGTWRTYFHPSCRDEALAFAGLTGRKTIQHEDFALLQTLCGNAIEFVETLDPDMEPLVANVQQARKAGAP